MKKLVLRWVGLAVVLTLLALLAARLGEWQLDRLQQRREANATMISNEKLEAVPYSELMGSGIPDDLQWRRATASGTYTGEQFQIRYRNFDDNPGIEVVAVMETSNGDAILVDRGFIPRQQGQPDTDTLPAPPAGEVNITGWINRDEHGKQSAIEPHDFKARLINSEAIGEFLGRDVVPGHIVLIESDPEDSDGLVALTPPELTEGPHFSYALQWFSFGAIALIGIVVLIRSDLKDHRKAQAKSQRQHAETGPKTGP